MCCHAQSEQRTNRIHLPVVSAAILSVRRADIHSQHPDRSIVMGATARIASNSRNRIDIDARCRDHEQRLNRTGKHMQDGDAELSVVPGPRCVKGDGKRRWMARPVPGWWLIGRPMTDARLTTGPQIMVLRLDAQLQVGQDLRTQYLAEPFFHLFAQYRTEKEPTRAGRSCLPAKTVVSHISRQVRMAL